MSNIPSSGHYGFVAPITQNMKVETTGLPPDVWRKLLLCFLIVSFVFCVVWLVRRYMEKNREKTK